MMSCYNGYNVIVKNRGGRGGGVAIYVKETRSFNRKLDLEPSDVECIWLEISCKYLNCLLCAVYRPPSSTTSYFDKVVDSIENACLNDKILTFIMIKVFKIRYA